jgi:hypothetical protein
MRGLSLRTIETVAMETFACFGDVAEVDRLSATGLVRLSGGGDVRWREGLFHEI